MEAASSDVERRARRKARRRAVRRRRATAVAVLAGVGALVVMSLDRSAPAGAPSLPDATSTIAEAPPPRGPRAAQLALDDKAIDDVLAYTPYITRGSHKNREVALTFDDGPGPTTPALVRYLVANHVPATFFLVGKAIGERPAIVRKQSEAGFVLGSHTESHARLGRLSASRQSKEILSTNDRIMQITGHAVKLFRPPYGSFDSSTSAVLRAHRMLMALWSVDTKDYSARRAKAIVSKALRDARAGSVVLMHDGPGARPKTLAAVRKIVPALRRRGYKLVTLPDLLRHKPPPRSLGDRG